MSNYTFPNDFLWGGAIAANQNFYQNRFGGRLLELFGLIF